MPSTSWKFLLGLTGLDKVLTSCDCVAWWSSVGLRGTNFEKVFLFQKPARRFWRMVSLITHTNFRSIRRFLASSSRTFATVPGLEAVYAAKFYITCNLLISLFKSFKPFKDMPTRRNPISLEISTYFTCPTLQAAHDIRSELHHKKRKTQLMRRTVMSQLIELELFSLIPGNHSVN